VKGGGRAAPSASWTENTITDARKSDTAPNPRSPVIAGRNNYTCLHHSHVHCPLSILLWTGH
jgi:hypothetical protein